MAQPQDWHKEDGFEFALFPAKNGKAKSLVIVLHGHGSNTHVWEENARAMQAQLPDADIITLQGPIRLPANHPKLVEPGRDGFTWLPHEGQKLARAKQSLTLAFSHLPVIDKVNHFIDKQLEKRGLTEKDLGLVGSSMGGIVALQAALYRKKPVAGVVSHSGALFPFTRVHSKPPILLVMGEQDEVFHQPRKKGLARAFSAALRPFRLQHRDTLRRFRKKHIPFTEVLYPDMKHENTPDSIRTGSDFLRNALAKKPPPPPSP